ncbi:MAG: hypothetical protein WB609_04580 [Candidatus Cybelea sp.]
MRIWALSNLLEWLNDTPPDVADEALRTDWAEYLTTAADTQINDPRVTELLLREVRYLIDSKIDLIKSSDSKAAMQVTVLGGGLGVLSILGASESVMIAAGIPWLLGPAVFLVVLGAFLDLVCLARGYRYTAHMPRIDVYNSPAVLAKPHMQARVATSLIEGYVTYSNDLTAVNSQKSRLLKAATISLVAGVVFLILNAAWADTRPLRQESTANCRFSGSLIRCILLRDDHTDRSASP